MQLPPGKRTRSMRDRDHMCTVDQGHVCCSKNYPGLGNRSIFHPCTFTVGSRVPMASLVRGRGRESGVDGPPGGGNRAGEGVGTAVMRCCRVAHEVGKVRRKFGNVGQGAASRIDYWGRRGERCGSARCVHLLLPTPLANRLSEGANPRSSG